MVTTLLLAREVEGVGESGLRESGRILRPENSRVRVPVGNGETELVEREALGKKEVRVRSGGEGREVFDGDSMRVVVVAGRKWEAMDVERERGEMARECGVCIRKGLGMDWLGRNPEVFKGSGLQISNQGENMARPARRPRLGRVFFCFFYQNFWY